MKIFNRLSLLSLAAVFAGGCATESHLRVDGLTTGAGDAIAANTVMQMVDPWQKGVQNPKLSVPVVRPPLPETKSDFSATDGQN